MSLIVNLFGGPGTGKSTTAAATFANLKYKGINAELVTEFAKDKVWEQSLNVLGNQPYLLGKQFHRLWRLKDVDVVVTDSPILLSLEYGKTWGPAFKNYVLELHGYFESLNYFLIRQKKYNPKGRVQSEEEAHVLDKMFKANLESLNVEFDILDADESAPSKIADDVLRIIQKDDNGASQI